MESVHLIIKSRQLLHNNHTEGAGVGLPGRRKFGVSNHVLDVLMPEVVLHRSRVVAVIGELKNHGYYRVAFDLMPDGKHARWIVA